MRTKNVQDRLELVTQGNRCVRFHCPVPSIDEGRKRVLLIARSILPARKLVNWDGRPSPALESAIADAIAMRSGGLSRSCLRSGWPIDIRFIERT
jgi:hypothetical protein